MTQLIRYEAARTALAEAHRIDEVKDIRDKAQALAVYARQARDPELIQMATEIKVRAERRCGEMLAEMEKAKGNRGNIATVTGGSVVRPPEQAKTLSDLGITKDQSSRYQRLAAMPVEHFEAAVEMTKEAAGEVTSAHMLRLADELRANRDLEDRLRVARATLDARSRDTATWLPIVSRVKGLFAETLKAANEQLPPCPDHIKPDLLKQWAAVSQFLSAHLERP